MQLLLRDVGGLKHKSVAAGLQSCQVSKERIHILWFKVSHIFTLYQALQLTYDWVRMALFTPAHNLRLIAYPTLVVLSLCKLWNGAAT